MFDSPSVIWFLMMLVIAAAWVGPDIYRHRR
jgi:hypothetical protein